jgi:hypothetical protein
MFNPSIPLYLLLIPYALVLFVSILLSILIYRKVKLISKKLESDTFNNNNNNNIHHN